MSHFGFRLQGLQLLRSGAEGLEGFGVLNKQLPNT